MTDAELIQRINQSLVLDDASKKAWIASVPFLKGEHRDELIALLRSEREATTPPLKSK